MKFNMRYRCCTGRLSIALHGTSPAAAKFTHSFMHTFHIFVRGVCTESEINLILKISSWE